MMRRIKSVGILTRNTERLAGFYSTATCLPLNECYDAGHDEALFMLAHVTRRVLATMACGDLEIVEVPSLKESALKAANSPGIRHICLQSSVSDPLLGKLENQGWEPISRGSLPIDLAGTGYYYAYGRDPEGNIIEVEHLSDYRHKESTWLGHVSIVAKDIEHLVAFYTALLGVGPLRRIERGNHPGLDSVADLDEVRLKMAWFVTAGIGLELIQYDNPPAVPASLPVLGCPSGFYKIGLVADSLEGEDERLASFGAEVLGLFSKFKSRKVLYARDPEGNLFSVEEPYRRSEESEQVAATCRQGGS